MPIFISYSHQDRQFVDRFAKLLVYHKVNVWMDRWELHVGDSMIDKIQAAIEGSSALMIILSKASVESEWCKKELSSGLLRELEEKRVVVLPIIIDDCKIPLFLRGKLFADFRYNYDEGFKTVLEAIAAVTSNFQNRIDEPQFFIDWAIVWGDIEGRSTIELIMVEQAEGQPYTVLNNVMIIADAIGTKEYLRYLKKEKREFANYNIISLLKKDISDVNDVRIRLVDQMPVKTSGYFIDEKSRAHYTYSTSTRRLGQDTGRDILFNLGDQVAMIKRQLFEINKPESDTWEKLLNQAD